MENINKDEVLENLKEKIEEDLKNAVTHEWGIAKEDAEIAMQLKSKLENMLTNLETSSKNTIAANENNNRFLALFERIVEDGSLDEDTKNLIEENIKTLKSTIDNNVSALNSYAVSAEVIQDVLNELSYEIKEDGKAYIKDTSIKFAKLLLKL
jgi:hypothetical protein